MELATLDVGTDRFAWDGSTGVEPPPPTPATSTIVSPRCVNPQSSKPPIRDQPKAELFAKADRLRQPHSEAHPGRHTRTPRDRNAVVRSRPCLTIGYLARLREHATTPISRPNDGSSRPTPLTPACVVVQGVVARTQTNAGFRPLPPDGSSPRSLPSRERRHSRCSRRIRRRDPLHVVA